MHFSHVIIDLAQRTELADTTYAAIKQRLAGFLDRPSRLAEELDYLLMAGILKGGDEAYQLTEWWLSRPSEVKNLWLFAEDRPALVKPQQIENQNLRNQLRTKYAWESQLAFSSRKLHRWESFLFPVARYEGDYVTDVGMLSGDIWVIESHSYQEKIDLVRSRISQALVQWSELGYGCNCLFECEGRFTILNLAEYIDPPLEELLFTLGVRNLELEIRGLAPAWNFETSLLTEEFTTEFMAGD
jgi:hypothetical protein